MDEKLLRILNVLSTKHYQTSSYIGLTLNISEKTVRNRIKEVDCIINKHGANIISKQRMGYKLQINNVESYDSFIGEVNVNNVIIPANSKERVAYIITHLLWCDDYLKLDDLADELYISKSTLNNDMKKAESILYEYNIEILRKPYYGMKIIGSEVDIRSCLVNQIEKRNFFQKSSDVELQYNIASILKDIVSKNDMYVSEMVLHDMVLHVYIAVKRFNTGHFMSSSIILHKWASENKSSSQQIAKEIAIMIQERVDIQLSPQEVDYIAIHLIGKKIVDVNSLQDFNFVISSEIYILAQEMIQIVYETYKIDFNSHFDIIMALCRHLVPLDIRLRYDISLENPLIDYIKKQYSYSFAIASQAILPIVIKYEKKLNEDEVGYIALILATFLETNISIEKKNVLLVCGEGEYIGKLLAFRYQEEFNQYLNEIKVCSVGELSLMRLKNIDYILTTSLIKMNVSVPIIEIKAFLEDDEILDLKKKFSKIGRENYINYFDKNLFFSHINFTDKEDVLKYMCDQVSKYRNISWKEKNFQQQILEKTLQYHTLIYYLQIKTLLVLVC